MVASGASEFYDAGPASAGPVSRSARIMTPRYQMISRVAESGFSTLDHALDRQRAIEVALKRPLGDHPGADQHFQTEVRVLGSVRHDHIVSLYDTGRDAEGGYLAMEWIAGPTLDHLIHAHALNDTALRGILRPLLQALAVLHAAGFAHADLNASNVMIRSDGQLKLIDFGNASPLGDSRERNLSDPNIGSIHLMAPELFNGRPPSVRTDLYAVGVMAVQALTQRHPFDGETKAQIITAHMRHICPHLPGSGLNQWIQQLIARDPAARPGSVHEALQSLPP